MGAFLPLALWTSSGLLGFATGAPRARVQVNGTTVGPGFERKEGKLAITCPSSAPYPYQSGARCCSSPWKYASGGGGPACDGGHLQINDAKCCGETAMGATSVPCSPTDPELRCKHYNGTARVLLNYDMGPHMAMLDVKNKCFKPLPIPYMEGTGVHWYSMNHFVYKGKIFACGGRFAPPDADEGVDKCYRLNEDTLDWELMAGRSTYKRSSPWVAAVDQGTSSETFFLGGGWKDGIDGESNMPVIDKLLPDASGWEDAGFETPRAAYVTDCMVQVAEDRFLLAAGFESWPTRSEEYHVYDRAAGSWAAAKEISPFYGPFEALSGLAGGTSCTRDEDGRLILATGIQERETFLYDPKVDSWQVATSGPGAGACGDWTVFYALGKTWGISQCPMLSDVSKLYELVKTNSRSSGGGRWREVATMAEMGGADEAHYLYTATPIPDGIYDKLHC